MPPNEINSNGQACKLFGTKNVIYLTILELHVSMFICFFLVLVTKSKAPFGSLWMNRAIPSWILPVWKESLTKIKCMSSFHSFSRKSSHFHAKRFASALDLKKDKQQLGSRSKVCIWAKWPIRPALIPVSVAWCD